MEQTIRTLEGCRSRHQADGSRDTLTIVRLLPPLQTREGGVGNESNERPGEIAGGRSSLSLLSQGVTPDELAFPVLCLSRDTSISVADDKAALMRCNALAFFKNRYFDNLLVIDSRRGAFRVTDAQPKRLRPLGISPFV